MGGVVRMLAILLGLLLVPGAGTGAAEGVPHHSRFLAGSLLIAAPRMRDPRFAETVIYLVDHDSGGAFGLVVNRPMGPVNLGELMRALALDTDPDTDAAEVLVRYGGPVQPDRLWVLHSADWVGDSTTHRLGPMAMSTGADVLEAIGHHTGPRRHQIVMGYAGWGPDQLEGEIARGDWITAPLDPDLVFGGDDAAKWRRASEIGGVAL